MGFKDPHDPREFRRFAKIDAKGDIVAMVEVADSAPDPVSTDEALHVEISALGRVDLSDVAVQTRLKPLIRAARAEMAKDARVADGG